MNVLKPNRRATIETLLERGDGQWEIHRKTGFDRKTIRKYERLGNLGTLEEASAPVTGEEEATGSMGEDVQNPPPRPPAVAPKHTQSACDPHREWIEEQVRAGRNGMSIYQDLVELFGFSHKYNSVKRFVRGMKEKDPQQYDRLEFLPGEEAQVDYGSGAPTRCDNGKYRKPRLFVMVLKYSGRAFRKVVWRSCKETWCKLHEEAFRYFGGCPEYVTLDNLKEGVIKPDLYDPELNELYGAMLAHYGVVADPARVRDPNRKGTVENGIKYTQDTALKGRRFEDIDAQNAWLKHWEESWASVRIHGRSKRQVEEMFQEERPYLVPLPLSGFAYFEQATRKVYDDGTIQLGRSYYAAHPADLHSQVVVRIYEERIEILDPVRMEVIRSHPKGTRPGSLMMVPGDRIFNPSRQTDRLLAQAERIGPHTFALCEEWFQEEGRNGQRRMYGLIQLVRHYPAVYVEKASALSKANGIRSLKALRGMVERMADKETSPCSGVTQDHPLIRSGEDYGLFWEEHASKGVAPQDTPSPKNLFRDDLSRIWEQASWPKVIAFFGLEVDPGRGRDDELWIKSPFTGEDRASMHVSLSENIFKDFSSGKGGGIMQFCREMLQRQGLEMSMLEVAQWMVDKGICTDSRRVLGRPEPGPMVNPAIRIDLRRYLRLDHPEWARRGISPGTCRYLGCGFLPKREKDGSPLHSRLVFQVRGITETPQGAEAFIVTHTGRALSREQEEAHGKYWSYPFRKSLEIYNQDHILLDPEASLQTNQFGLILTEGFFDVAKLIEGGCRNGVALMGNSLSPEQMDRLMWLHARVQFPRILLFLDRDVAGQQGALEAQQRLSCHDIPVTVFDWAHLGCCNGLKDPADLSVEQIKTLRSQGMI